MQRKDHTKKALFPDGSRLRVGIVVSKFHNDITRRMLDGALDTLRQCKVKEEHIKVLRVPGSFEIPLGCLMLIKRKKFDALVALGCIVKGETDHNVYIASAVSKGIMDFSLLHSVPIGFGVITANTLAQAAVRSKGKTNRGSEAALAAVAMAVLKS